MLGRLATVGRHGHPHAVPVGFRYNPDEETIDIGGHGFGKARKFRDAQGNPWVAFVVDDVASVQPWRVRGIEVRGVADVLSSGGEVRPGFDAEMFRIRPRHVVSWGLEDDNIGRHARSDAR